MEFEDLIIFPPTENKIKKRRRRAPVKLKHDNHSTKEKPKLKQRKITAYVNPTNTSGLNSTDKTFESIWLHPKNVLDIARGNCPFNGQQCIILTQVVKSQVSKVYIDVEKVAAVVGIMNQIAS